MRGEGMGPSEASRYLQNILHGKKDVRQSTILMDSSENSAHVMLFHLHEIL